MDFFDFIGPRDISQHIRNILSCPYCGGEYDHEDVRIIAHLDRNYATRLTCHECSNSIMASFSYQNGVLDGSGQIKKRDPYDVQFGEMMRFAEQGVITDNDIMDLCKATHDFDGNFKKLFQYKKIV